MGLINKSGKDNKLQTTVIWTFALCHSHFVPNRLDSRNDGDKCQCIVPATSSGITQQTSFAGHPRKHERLS
jgi:hypothetical protein